jgi:hypothetical protein
MKTFKEIWKTQLGMTLAEMVVGGALAGAAALGAASLMGNMSGSTKEAEVVIERTQFASAMGVYLNSGLGCDEFKSASAAGAIKEIPTPFKITNWRFGGQKSFEANPVTNIFTETKFFKIAKLNAYIIKPTNPRVIKLKDGTGVTTLYKAIMRVEASIAMRDQDKVEGKNKVKRWNDYDQAYDMEVLLDSANVVKHCQDDSSIADTCSSLNGVYDESTGECEMDESCFTYGSYITLNCYPVIDGSCDTSRGTSQVNPVTGQLSCPAGTTSMTTGLDTWTKQVNCGKKCTADVNNTIGFYTCVQCQ